MVPLPMQQGLEGGFCRGQSLNPQVFSGWGPHCRPPPCLSLCPVQLQPFLQIKAKKLQSDLCLQGHTANPLHMGTDCSVRFLLCPPLINKKKESTFLSAVEG